MDDYKRMVPLMPIVRTLTQWTGSSTHEIACHALLRVIVAKHPELCPDMGAVGTVHSAPAQTACMVAALIMHKVGPIKVIRTETPTCPERALTFQLARAARPALQDHEAREVRLQ